MQHIFGIILRNSDIEIMEDESPGKGSYNGLHDAMIRGRNMGMKNPNIKQINIYSIKQGQRVLDQSLFFEIESTG